MRTYNVNKSVKLFSLIVFIFAGILPSFGQRTLQPVSTKSLIAAPVFLDRQSSINDLEITSTNHLDTLIVNQVALFTGYVKNSSDIIFDAAININFNLNQLEEADIENMDEDIVYDTDASLQLPHIPIQPGDSIPFLKFINIDPNKIDPNSNGVIIIWPEFRIAPINNVEPGYSVDLFYAAGLVPGDHPNGPGKTLNNNNSYKISNILLNSFSNLQNHLAGNNYDSAEIIMTTVDGKIILHQNQLPRYSRIKNIMLQNSSKIVLLNVIAKKFDDRSEILTVKLQNSTF